MYVRNIIIRFCDGAPSTAFTYLFTHTIPLLVYTLGYTVLLYTHSYSKHAILQRTHTWTTLPNKVHTCTIEVGMVPFPPLSQLCSPEREGESVWERERGWSMYVCMYIANIVVYVDVYRIIGCHSCNCNSSSEMGCFVEVCLGCCHVMSV